MVLYFYIKKLKIFYLGYNIKEIQFETKIIKDTIEYLKKLGEQCNNSAKPLGIRRHNFYVEIYNLNNQLIFDGYFFKDFSEFVKILYKIKDGIIRYSCNPQPY